MLIPRSLADNFPNEMLETFHRKSQNERGFKPGLKESPGSYLLFNHLDFHLSYNQENDKFHVVDFLIVPDSIDYKTLGN